MKRVTLIVFLFLCRTTGLLAQAQPLTLDRAIELFLERNVEVQAARYQIDRAKAERIAAGMRPNPVLTVTAENFKLTGATPFDRLYEVGASYSETIERGGKREARKQVADLTVSVAEATFEDVLRQKLGELKLRYFEAVLAHHNVEIVTGNRDTVEQLVRLNTVRFENGAIAEGDLLKVRLERVRFDSAVRQAQLEEAQAMIQLLEKLEEPDFGVRPLAGSLEMPLVTLNLASLKARALQKRPDLKAAGSQIALARERISLEHARAVPDLTPFVGYRRNASNNTILFGVSLPLQLRNRNEGGITRALQDEKLAVGQREVVVNEVAVGVESAFRSYEAARDQVVIFRDQLIRQADEAQTITLAAYEEGATELLPVLEAQRTRSEIQKEYFRRLFDYQASLLELELAVGERIQP